LWAGLCIVLVVSFFASMSVGVFRLTWSELLASWQNPAGSKAAVILWELRLPRALLGVMVGAVLGLAGAAMQGFLRNPLAEPGIMGITGGAVFGAVLVFYTGIYARYALALPLAGMAGALLVVAAIYVCAGSLGSIQTLILVGVAVNTLAFAATSLALNLCPNPYAALEIVFWQLGSLADRSFVHVRLAFPFMAVGGLLLLWDRRALDALTLGEETALSLGIPLKRVRFRMILGTAMAVGAAVSVAGSIGFVGLVVPHILRPLVRHEPGKLLAISATGGAILLLWADIAVRLIPSVMELKLGVVTALVGAPFFLSIIFAMRRRMS